MMTKIASKNCSKGVLRVLLITTEYPSRDRPGGAAYLIRHIRALRLKGHQVDVLPFVSRMNPLNHFDAWRKMRKMLQENQYDVIHAHFGHAALVARLQCSVPLVITYHGSDLLGICGADGRYTLKGKLASSLNRALSLTANGVIVVARHLGERLPRQDWHLIPLGVDLERFAVLDKGEARDQLGWAQEPFIVLFAALNTSTPVKRFPLAKAALQLLQTKVHAELKVAEGIPPEMMPIYMNAADALLLTSAHEGSPTVVKEALACDLPVVATDVGDVRERLQGVTLSSVCEADPAALAAALEQIAAAKPRRSNGRKKIEHLSEPFVAERVADVYRSVLGNH